MNDLEKTADGFEIRFTDIPDALFEPSFENATYSVNFYARIKHLPIEVLERYHMHIMPKGIFNKMSYHRDTKRKIRHWHILHVLFQKKYQAKKQPYKQLLLFRP